MDYGLKHYRIGGGGGLCSPLNFVVSSSITIKFGVLIEFDKFSLKQPKRLENDVTAEYDAIFCLRLWYF